MDRTAFEVEHHEAYGAGVDASSGRADRPQKVLFGRADLTRVYRRARELIVKHGVFRMRQVTTANEGAYFGERDQGFRRIVIKDSERW